MRRSVIREASPVKVPHGPGSPFAVLVCVREDAAGISELMVTHNLEHYPEVREGLEVKGSGNRIIIE